MFDGHVLQPEDVLMRQHLEQPDLSQGCDGELYLVSNTVLLR